MSRFVAAAVATQRDDDFLVVVWSAMSQVALADDGRVSTKGFPGHSSAQIHRKNHPFWGGHLEKLIHFGEGMVCVAL